jgi:hypothetical protein
MAADIQKEAVEEAADALSGTNKRVMPMRVDGLPLPYNWTTQNNGAALASTISRSQRWRNPTSSSTSRTRPDGRL